MANNSRAIPSELLDGSPEDRSTYFQQYIVNHQYLATTVKEVTSFIRNPINRSIALDIGPSGSGKTTTVAYVEHKLNEWAHNDPNWNPGRIPCIRIAVPQDVGKVDFPDVYERILEKSNEILLDKKVSYEIEMTLDATGQPRPQRVVQRRKDFRKALEDMLKERRPYAVLLDESQHLLDMASSKDILKVLDTIKSLADEVKVPFVLFGTYDMLPFVELNPQLNRRTERIHLKRYDYRIKEEKQHFQAVLKAFQANLPLRNTPDLASHHKELWEGSVGCVGLLKNWLERALYKAINDDERKPFYDCVKMSRSSTEELKVHLRDILDGEEAMKKFENNESDYELEALLYSPTSGVKNDTERTDQSKGEEKQHKNIGQRKPGKRKPKRDQVGQSA